MPGALGATLLLSGHAYAHHPPWHAVVFAAVWTGLLVLFLALVLLDVRTPSLPIARSAEIAMLGLGLAGVCGAACPDSHFLSWWFATDLGGWLVRSGGPALGALCFGAVTTLVFAAGAVVIRLRRRLQPTLRPLLPAATLLALLAPGVVLQSTGLSGTVLASWLLGSAAGAYAGVTAGLRLRSSG